MISRKTIFAFLLMLLVGVGVFAWNGSKRDECDLAGTDKVQMDVAVGQAGKKTLVVNCSEWLPRQPARVQAWCFVDAALAVVFGLSLLGDVVGGYRWRTELRNGRARR